MKSLNCDHASLTDKIRLALRRPARLGNVLMIGISSALLSTPPVNAVELPQACVGGACVRPGTNTAVTWVTSGAATASVSGNSMTVNQSTENVTLNWASFNISADGKVIFSQPSTSSIALNRIFQQSPSQIFGSIKTQLNSDASKPGGQIYLINPNGFLFGSGSSVSAAGILVSTLSISDAVFSKGLLSAIQSNKAALELDTAALAKDADGNPIKGSIVVQQGAKLEANAAGGRVMLASSNIDNAGELHADDGQIILAAGDKVYIAAANQNGDPLRGLYVEVGGDGTALNDVTGLLSAKRGDISIVGMAINQQGRISATTSVSANGSVHLLARKMDDVAVKADYKGTPVWVPSNADSGVITLGSKSSINIGIADEDVSTTAVDAQTQDLSNIQIAGKQIYMQGGANIVAHGGNLTLHASINPNAPLAGATQVDNDARLRIDSGAVIDLSGNNATRSVADNIVSVELRGSELADSPDQRNGVLRGKTVTVDARVGTPIADVSGAIGSIGKTVAQRTSAGGTATFVSTGDIVADKDAHIDVSGGQTNFTGAMVSTSQLLTADGKTVDIANARADATYVGVIGPARSLKHDRWGVIETVSQQSGAHYEAGYTFGSSAGSVAFDARAMIVNATLSGHAVNGVYQRDPSSATYATGGKLIIGENNPINNLNYRAPAVVLTALSANIAVSDDTSVSGIPLILSTDYLHTGGFTQTEINSNETVTIADDASMTLAAGSKFSVHASQINVNSSITAPAGVLDFNSLTTTTHPGGGIHIADNVQLNVSGQWINDTEVANNALPTTTLFQNAGSISLNTTNVNGQLNIGNNTGFIADGGGWLKSSGTVMGGNGGGVALLSNGQNSSFYLGDHVNLSGYGVNGASGGTVSLSAGRIQVTQRNSWADAQVYDPASQGSLWYFTISPKLFRDYGFNAFNITATGGTLASQGDVLQIAAGTNINAVADTLLLSANVGGHHSGDDVHSFASVTTFDPYLRSNASAISFSVKPNATDSGNATTGVGRLVMSHDSSITGDPGLKVNFSTINASIDIEGAIQARAGIISAHIAAPSPDVAKNTPNDPTLGITIGTSATLDASGSFVSTPNDSGLLQGILKDGGTVSLVADRGSVLIGQNATVNVSGTQALLDIPSAQSGAPYQRTTVAANAGNINLAAAESIVIAADLQAHAGHGATGSASGGSLSMSLTRSNANADSSNFPASFPSNDRIVELTTAAANTSSADNGYARINVNQLQSAGIDNVSLQADNTIKIDSGVNLSLERRLQIDAPAIQLGDGTINLTAGYVSMGSSQPASANVVATHGNGVFNINADNLDLVGSAALQNLNALHVISHGDIRLTDVLANGKRQQGNLQAAGDIVFEASRLYATTATQFSINTIGYDFTLKQGAPSPGVPLSAASSITINANTVHQNGSLLAPFGTIAINANDISLGAGSVTSVSAKGAVIPYGITDSNGKIWLYNGATIDSLPDRAVLLNGSNDVSIASNATVDLSGGGDLQAYEWVKGTGGSNDAFDFKLDAKGNPTTALTDPGLFAIMPSLGTQLAPLDLANAAVTSAQGLKAGDTIYLSGTGSLPAGFYTLLPANYSLLDGAYLISAVSGFNNAQPNMIASLADGTPVVAGYRSFGTTGLGGSSYTGFAVYPGDWGQRLAEYHLSDASSFFDAASHRTVDAGQLSIVTGNTLSANGIIDSSAAPGGRAATIDISANNLQIVGTIGQGATGVVQLQDSVLNSWHAGSILLGGVRQDNGASIAVAADTVSVTDNAHLSADEVVLVARDTVSVDSGSSVQSTSATDNKTVKLSNPSTVSLKGTGADKAALIAVSDIAAMQITRDNSASSNAQGKIALANGSMIATHGALNIDAPNGGVLQSSINGSDADWTLSSSHLVLGDNSTAGQLNINAALFNDMQRASAITLRSNGAIDFDNYANGTSITLGNNTTSISNITLQAAALNNLSGKGVSFGAATVNLNGVAVPESLVTASPGSGSLSVNANLVNVTGHAVGVGGFANVQLQADQELKVSGNSTLSVGGDLDVSTARITAGSASNGALLASGNVLLTSQSPPSSVALPVNELGGGLSIQGNNITDNANIVMPSGVVSLKADSLLTLGSTAVVDVSGVPVYAAGVRADSSGGVIHLSSGSNMSAIAGSQLKVDGSEIAHAGIIDINAGGALDLKSTLSAASSGSQGGSIVINANRINQFLQLDDVIQQANFTQQQSIHVDQGDLQLTADRQLTAHDVQWVTDAGHIQVDGVISAASTQDRSSIRLYGADGVNITGELHADGDPITGRGGIIEIGVSTDTSSHAGAAIDIANSVITAAGNEQGRLRLRAPIVNGDDVNVSALPNDLSSLSQVTVEAVSVMPVTTSVDWNAVNVLANSSYNSLSSNGSLQTRLLNNAKVLLSPGVELTSSDDINLGAVDIYSWNINNHNTPVALAVRTTGNINVNGVISDGYTSSGTGTRKYLSATDTPSATLRLTAGSNLNSADPLAMMHNGAADLTLNSNSIIRTGTGDVSLAAAHDVIFNGTGASVYTGGNNTPDQPQILIGTTGASASFLIDGGNLSINAGNDVTGFAVTQSVTAWQPRTTSSNNAAFNTATIYWGEDLRQFQWNVGTLGGGDISINANHDVSTLSVAAADTGIVNASRDTVTHYGGGAIDIHAGDDINSGMLYAGRQSANIVADNEINAVTWNNSTAPVGFFVSMGDSQVTLNARSGLSLASIVNPTALDFPLSANKKAYFFTYGPDAGVSITATSGDVVTQQGDPGFTSFFGSTSSNDVIKRALPPNLQMTALSGDVDATSRQILFPSDTGNLSVYAAGDINNLNLTMSDAADSSLPIPFNPLSTASAGGIDTGIGLGGVLSARHTGDTSPVTIAAGGDIVNAVLELPKFTRINAGRDINNLSLHAQNLSPSDVTEIIAGRDIISREQGRVISIGGPGRMDLIAGRDIDLGVSFGVESTGRLNNANINDQDGADISMLAGMSAGWNVPNFIDKIVAMSDPALKDSPAYSLISYVQGITGNSDMSLDDAVSTFKLFSVELQRPFVLQTFFGELVASAREHNAGSDKGYERGYAAVDALFPDSRGDDTPYKGNISMLFSRVYTLSGGNIDMLAPGGNVDVGVAARPRSTTQNKEPGQLGIVAEQAGNIDIFTRDDVSVNSSRIFTLGGGDIAIWSTLGNIDAGKGSKSSLSIPPPQTTIDSQGNVTLVLTGAVAGSGIRTIQTGPDTRPGNVTLIAPVGTVDAGDAGIGASGNIIVAAAKVQGAENINFGGQASGVPAATSGVGVSLAGASQTGGSSDKNVDKSIDDNSRNKEEKSSIAQAALSWLEVFVTGLGEENCKQDDMECLKRQK